jgi:hypothetical protein
MDFIYFLPLSGKETGKPILAREIPGSGPECRSESSDRACIIAKISYFAEWLEHLTANVPIVLGSILASSDTVESEKPQVKQFVE